MNTESGNAPVLELGVSHILSDSTMSMLALQRWAAQRHDVTTPFIPAGGTGPGWIAAMLRPVPGYEERVAPEPTIVYAGANKAEYLASLNLLHAAADRSGTLAPAHMAIPASQFVPQSQPGKTVSWDSLPFVDLFGPVSFASAETAGDVDNGVQNASGDPVQDWLAWTGLLMAFFLVLLAVLL